MLLKEWALGEGVICVSAKPFLRNNLFTSHQSSETVSIKQLENLTFVWQTSRPAFRLPLMQKESHCKSRSRLEHVFLCLRGTRRFSTLAPKLYSKEEEKFGENIFWINERRISRLRKKGHRFPSSKANEGRNDLDVSRFSEDTQREGKLGWCETELTFFFLILLVSIFDSRWRLSGVCMNSFTPAFAERRSPFVRLSKLVWNRSRELVCSGACVCCVCYVIVAMCFWLCIFGLARCTDWKFR